VDVTVDRARELMESWTQNLALRAHMEAVAACMIAYAGRLAPDDVDRWAVCGLLHDFDYEKHPTAEEHPFVGVKELERLGVDREIRTAILGHAQYSGVARESAMAKALFAVDELAGFIVACCKVRPDGAATLEPRSVKKKLKDKSFAAAVNREDIRLGAEELGVEMDEHIGVCIEAIRAEQERVGV
jgi:putative nucleotidyltransferase with HDIG domain